MGDIVAQFFPHCSMVDPTEPQNADEKKAEEKEAKTIMLKEPEIMYCQQTLLNMTKEEAILSFISGEVAAARFAYTYPHLKRLRNVLDM
jgi:hypothetical protein